MADVQKQFERFHATIRIDYDMATELREKREIIIEKILKWLREHGHPVFTVLLQGSYKMKTGSKPIEELEYDMDIGLRFDLHPDHFSAEEVREWVLSAVDGHTDRVEDKGPCIRVAYGAGYHLDLVVYAFWQDASGAEQFRLAHKSKGWRMTDPPGLLQYVDDYRTTHFNDTEDSETKTDQFRRCVRCLRRWNDYRLPYEAEKKPVGLAYVLLAIQRQLSRHTRPQGGCDDRAALVDFTRRVSQTVGRVTAPKPTPEYEDLFERLSNSEMDEFKHDLGALAGALEFAGQTSDPVEACKRLQEVFGPDFPVPEPADTGKRTAAPAIIVSSTSA
jgi:predicted nucleotidyltransferase